MTWFVQPNCRPHLTKICKIKSRASTPRWQSFYQIIEFFWGEQLLLALNWTSILPLLEEHHYGDGVDVGSRYDLATLQRAVGWS